MPSAFPVRTAAACAAALALWRSSWLSGWSSWSRWVLCLSLVYLPSYLDGAEYKPAPRRCKDTLCKAIIRQVVRWCFDIRPAVLEDPVRLAACKQHILVVHPHGVLSLGHGVTVMAFDEALEKVLPQQQRSALSAGVLFKIPVVREQLLWSGAVDAGRPTAKRCLSAGLSLSVVPGGEREQLLAQRGKTEQLVLKRRQGFIRLALQHGVPVIPVYCFGEAQLYRQSRFLLGLRLWLQQTLGIALVLPFGPFCIPGLPFRGPFQLVVGSPMEMPRVPEPSQDEVTKHHQRYMDEVCSLFERNKAACGYGHVSLELL